LENYFNYFTEIEEHFHRQRGTSLLLSTLDWALIETWKDAGIPLEAVLRGIDATFEHYNARPAKTRKINGLAFCSQEVLAAAEDMQEAAVGANAKQTRDAAISNSEVASFLCGNATQLEKLLNGGHGDQLPPQLEPLLKANSNSLREMAGSLNDGVRLEDLERHLTVMEEKLFAALLAATPDSELVQVRAEADRDLAPYRRKMPSAQIEQLHRQYVHKRLLERHGVPRLSLFYV
jgi:hypothetical protein